MSRASLVRAFAVVLLLVGGAFWMGRGSSPKPNASTGAEGTATSSSVTAPTAGMLEPTKAKPPVVSEASEATKKDAGAAAVATAPSTASVPFEREKDFNQYAALKQKVFLSDEEKKRMSDLTQDPDFIRSLKTLLSRQEAMTSDAQMSAQGTALDLLLEALNGSARGVAEDVMRDLVLDPIIENAALNPDVRENLAGMKAELLFHWVSADPGKADEIPAWLPGPVSSKIWKNVVDAQQQNLAESALEMRK